MDGMERRRGPLMATAGSRARWSDRTLAAVLVGAKIAVVIVGATLATPLLAQGPSLAAGGSQIARGTLEDHLVALTADDLGGRSNGTEGARRAAEYVAERFRSYGLEPAGTSAQAGDPSADQRDGSGAFFHPTTVFTGVRVEGVIGLQDENRGYAYNHDWTPLGLSDDGEYLGSLVFAGYGIEAPEYGYDDYAGLDVAGRIVLVFLGEPGMRDANSPFAGTAPTVHSDLYRKAEVARAKGARGLLVTPGPLYAKDPDEVWRISQQVGFRNTGILACQIAGRAAQSLVAPSDLDLAALQKQIDDRHRPASQAVKNRVEMKVRLKRTPTPMANVVARIPGRSERAVVLAANLDGYGLGEDSAQPLVHPSANDNATGLATLLEVARVCEQMPTPERTIYFVATAGRRLTSAGSEALLREAVIDPADVDLFVNLFALGTRNVSALTVMGTGSADGLDRLLGDVNRQVAAPVALSTDRAVSSAGDHIPWFRVGVPVLTLFGGASEEIGTPFDTLDRIDWGPFERRARFTYGLIRAVAERSAGLSANG